MKRYPLFLSVLFIVLISMYTPVSAQSINATDSLALVELYNSTNGQQWNHNDNWLAAPVSSWFGVTVNNGRVTKLSLAFNNLSGSLPAAIIKLDKLQYLDAGYNNLSGTIPAAIDKLFNLTELYLSSNFLSGSIPTAITSMVQLQKLYLDFNELSGSIPAEIGQLTNLTQLQLSYNQLTGAIPASVSKLNALTGLYLSNNQLSSGIPDFEEGSGLLNLYLDHNQLTGSIPASFRNLKHLVIANVSFNQLSQSNNVDFTKADPKQTGFANMSYNHFTFDGLEFIAAKFAQVVYSPQTKINLHQHGNTLVVSAGGTLSNNTYNWYRVGTKGSTATLKGDSTFTPTTSGKYFVKVTNAIANKLTLSSDTIEVAISNIAESSNLMASTTATYKGNLQVYPNPASSILNVKTNGTAHIKITNGAGAVVLTKSFTSSATLNVSGLANGIYYIQNKITGETQKLIVQH